MDFWVDDLEGVTKVKSVNMRAGVEGWGVNLNSEKSCIKNTVQKIKKILKQTFAVFMQSKTQPSSTTHRMEYQTANE
jgi:hypothetical protein